MLRRLDAQGLRWLDALGMAVFWLGCVWGRLRLERTASAAAFGAFAWLAGGLLGMFLAAGGRPGPRVLRAPGAALGALGAGLALAPFGRLPWAAWLAAGLAVELAACRAAGWRAPTPREREDQEIWAAIWGGLALRWLAICLGGAVGLGAALAFVGRFGRLLPGAWDVGALALGVLFGLAGGWLAGEHASDRLLERSWARLLSKASDEPLEPGPAPPGRGRGEPSGR
jgi:hypothetical protein